MKKITYLLIFLTYHAFGQVCNETLTTTYAGGNGASGIMFDVTAINTITIQNFEGNLHPSVYSQGWDIEIYYKTGTHIGSESSSSAWTLVGSYNMGLVVPWGLQGQPSEIPIPINITIPAGQTYAFYVTVAIDGNAVMRYTPGTIIAADANLRVDPGTGLGYPFLGSGFYPRRWNGTINYTASCGAICSNPCSNTSACNFGACEPCLLNYGCMNDNACNYDPLATCDVGCIYRCGDVNSCNYEGCLPCDYSCFSIVKTINPGWHMVANPCYDTMPVEQSLQSIESSIMIAKDDSGASYIPSLGLNTIGSVYPGGAIKVKLSKTDTLMY